ncbi:tRNA pseudouridine(13) synthase TruD [Thalassotalea ganghwensis]
MTLSLSYLNGKPSSRGLLRSQMQDFVVLEQLPFEPSGEGEHLLVNVRKSGQNTVFVAQQLAKFFKVKPAQVTYAGLKDRFAVTEQWFGVHLPGKGHDSLDDFSVEGVEVIAFSRHHKKLRTGALSGNRFIITLRDVDGLAELQQRWQAVTKQGVPNYYGEQRFGINQGNIESAKAMFSGKKIKDRKKRSIYLSAARSYLFNTLLSQRVEAGKFSQIQPGDIMMLAGSQSIFPVTDVDETLTKRLEEGDIDITSCLWGQGELRTGQHVAELESELKQSFPELCQGLEQFGLKQERRRIRLMISDAKIEFNNDAKLAKLDFFLPSGSFATTVLRELLVYKDMTERHNAQGIKE